MPVKERQFTVGLGPLGPCADRFAAGGYRETTSLEERIELLKGIEDLDGIELHSHLVTEDHNLDFWNGVLERNGWVCSIVSANVWGSAKWANGSLTNPDPAIRADALGEIKRTMDIAAATRANKINLWLGQDGHDYPFETDYRWTWERIVEGVAEAAHHSPEVKICLEPKLKEPRVHMAVGTVGKVLYIVNAVGLDNVGANLDVGHAVQAFETPAESAVLLARENALFHLHFNDNPGDWDWDLTTGSYNLWDLIELCFWLDELGFDDVYSFDIFPRRVDPKETIEDNSRAVQAAFRIVERLDRDSLIEMMAARDASATRVVTRMVLEGK
jgi:xylose isomerase